MTIVSIKNYYNIFTNNCAQLAVVSWDSAFVTSLFEIATDGYDPALLPSNTEFSEIKYADTPMGVYSCLKKMNNSYEINIKEILMEKGK